MLSDDVRSALLSRSDLAAKQDRDRIRFRCPRHEDKNPSAWMQNGSWGCFACGFTESITTLAEELGVELAKQGNGQSDVIESEFSYTDEGGELLYQVVRMWPKRFLQRKPDRHGGWDWKTRGVRRVLYRLPEVLAAAAEGRTVYVVEGEKHVDRLRADGLVATTNPGGAGKWRVEYSEALRGANVVILPDNDDVGRQHARQVAASLHGIATEVKVVQLAGLEPKGDVLDWLEAGHTTAELDELAWDTKAGTDVEEEPEAPRFPAPMSVLDLLKLPEPEEIAIVEPFLPADANVLLAAYPKCFKTGFLLTLSLAAASGRRFLGMFDVPRRHRVGLVLMEDRAHRIRRRLQRLCAGAEPRSMEMESLQGQIWSWFRPPLFLAEPASVGQLGRYVEEHELDLLIVDSWAYVSAGNPNDADIVTPQLMALSGIRDRAPGLSVLLVHHARKTIQGATGMDDERLTDIIRNSSAFGAWYDSGIVLSRKNEMSPITVRMELRDLPAPDPFTFTVEDEFPAGPENGLRPDGWLRVVASKEHPSLVGRRADIDRLSPAVLEYLHANPGTSKRDLRSGIKARAADVDATFEHLRREGAARFEQQGRSGACYATTML
jgi:hypothetical protein